MNPFYVILVTIAGLMGGLICGMPRLTLRYYYQEYLMSVIHFIGNHFLGIGLAIIFFTIVYVLYQWLLGPPAVPPAPRVPRTQFVNEIIGMIACMGMLLLLWSWMPPIDMNGFWARVNEVARPTTDPLTLYWRNKAGTGNTPIVSVSGIHVFIATLMLSVMVTMGVIINRTVRI